MKKATRKEMIDFLISISDDGQRVINVANQMSDYQLEKIVEVENKRIDNELNELQFA